MSHATRLAAQLARQVAKLVADCPATITYGSTDYTVRIDPGALAQELELGGMNTERSIEVLVPNTSGLTPALGRTFTVKTTATAALQTLVFTVTAVNPHSDLPAVLVTGASRP